MSSIVTRAMAEGNAPSKNNTVVFDAGACSSSNIKETKNTNKTKQTIEPNEQAVKKKRGRPPIYKDEEENEEEESSDDDENEETISKKIKKADLSKASKTSAKNESKERGKIAARARELELARLGDQLNNQFGNVQTMQLVQQCNSLVNSVSTAMSQIFSQRAGFELSNLQPQPPYFPLQPSNLPSQMQTNQGIRLNVSTQLPLPPPSTQLPPPSTQLPQTIQPLTQINNFVEHSSLNQNIDTFDLDYDDDNDIENRRPQPSQRQLPLQKQPPPQRQPPPPQAQHNRQLTPVEIAYRTARRIQADMDIRNFIETNEDILRLKLRSCSTSSFAVNLALFFFTEDELGADNTNVLGVGPNGYQGGPKNSLDFARVNCIRRLILSYERTSSENEKAIIWKNCVNAINKKMWVIRKKLLARFDPQEISLN